MLPSVEVRWFCPGPAPGGVRRWFEAVTGVGTSEAAAERRTDAYLVPESEEGPGVKLRAGQALEVKTMVQRIGVETWGTAAGTVRAWQKRRLALPAAPGRAGEAWVDVTKTRWERSFALRDGEVLAVDPARRAADLELTAVEALGEAWWSVCIESFGPSGDGLADQLRAVARHVFDRPDGPVLEAARSHSYPGWLLRDVAPLLDAA